MKLIKQWLPDVLAVVFFAVLAFAYFYPADVQDRVLSQGDVSAGMGMGEEASQYYQKTGERTRWTNSLFSGMPTYQISPSYNSTDLLSKVENAYHLWLPDNVWYLFVYLLGFYILLRAFDLFRTLGLQHLFSDYHRCRSPMEGDGIGLSAANDWRYCFGFQEEIPMGTGSNRTIWRP